MLHTYNFSPVALLIKKLLTNAIFFGNTDPPFDYPSAYPM